MTATVAPPLLIAAYLLTLLTIPLPILQWFYGNGGYNIRFVIKMKLFISGLVYDRGFGLGDLLGELNEFFSRLGKSLAGILEEVFNVPISEEVFSVSRKQHRIQSVII
ncbi:uncharacterized protein LOC126612390 [Malus sylvestris]|uniref:uncharacterized protein LOC126612390 n=1 Tax=Malus sylvestris TaxID=3752 RepID=UPI0021AD4176|nr:uncharacterized protein LOC126612390 [Malus sylvestris]